MKKPFVSNPKLEFIQTPFEWSGNPVDKDGRFINLHKPFIPKFSEVFKWKTNPNPFEEAKKQDNWTPKLIKDTSPLKNDRDVLVWLGHASFFLQLQGKKFLFDPVFGDINFLLKRRVAFPWNPDALKQIDYCLLSHDHRDHLDTTSLKTFAQNNPNAAYLTGLGIKSTLEGITGSKDVTEAGWFQRYATVDDIKVYYLPSRHWGRRWLTDTNKRLWGAFVIEAGGKRIYFGGDSGYDQHFSEARELFGGFDICILGVGAFRPEWFMYTSHMSPTDGIQAFHDLNGKVFVPMHHGTFDLSDEPAGEPYRTLVEAEKTGKINGALFAPGVGEPYYF
ncbi:MAG: MBL fold metallo-hydrolase [Saprospiraceae bacterium]|nr:MBL fold metallo-hydrolase [Saprospiraceae bacterium]